MSEIGSRVFGGSTLRRWVAGAAVSLLTSTGLLAVSAAIPARADTAPPAGLPATVSADALPTVQINGVVWGQATVGNTVYVTGSFSQSRPAGAAAGTNQTARSNLLAYNITTGALITSFNHPLNAQGRYVSASPDGTRVYVGGDFTTVDGVSHGHIVAFDTATGARVASFAPTMNGTVRAITATNSTVYVAGDFTTANGTARTYFAAFAASNGALQAWNPVVNAGGTAIVLAPDNSRVILGGRFTTINGAAFTGIGAVNSTTGANVSWNPNFPIKDAGSGAALTRLVADGSLIYGTAYQFQTGGNFEGRFAADPYTGNIVWLNSCHGDSYDAWPIGQVLYSAGHSHDCSDAEDFSQDLTNVFDSTHYMTMAESTFPTGIERNAVFAGGPGIPGPRYSSFGGQPHSAQLNWYPTLSLGTFTGQSQAAWSVTGNSNYLSVGGEFPRVNGTAQQGLVRFAIRSIAPNAIGPANSSNLTPTAVSQTSGTARVTWRAGQDQDNEVLTYRLYRDGGNTPIYTQTLNSRFWYRPMLGYLDTGLAIGSSHTYRVTVTDPIGNVRTSGTSAAVTIGNGTLSSYTQMVRGDGASDFWPLSEASGTAGRNYAGINDLTYGSAVTHAEAGPPAAGNATAATFDGTTNSTTATVGNGLRYSTLSVEAWVKTTTTAGGGIVDYGNFAVEGSINVDRTLYMGPSGKLYFGIWNNEVNNTVASTLAYNDGQWHHIVGTVGSGSGMTLYVDGAAVASNPSITSSPSVLAGYWRVGGDLMNRWTEMPTHTGTFNPPNPPTLAAPHELTGSIADVAVYPAVLSPAQVAAHYGSAPANQSPTASFTHSCTELACSVDGSGSADPDGAIASYAWTFGDGGTATGATASHTYAASGTYTVGLTVTDDDGATNSTSQQVTVNAGTQTTYALDTFNRTVASGWGTADTGGAWSLTGSAANYAVTPGTATMRLTTAGAGSGTAYLGSVSATDVEVATTVSYDKVGLGNGTTLYVVSRRTSGTSQYRGKVRVASTGAVLISFSKLDGSSTETALTGETTVSGLTYTAGTRLRIRYQTTGTSPTTLRLKVWQDGTAEPASWQQTTTDSSAGLQGAGNVALSGYLSSGATNVPITASFTAFSAVQPA